MALPDPIPTLTVNSVNYDFARIGMNDTSSIYQTANGNDRLTVSRQNKKRNRFVARIDRNFTAEDPLISSIMQRYSHSVYTVFDSPVNGVTPADNDKLGQLLAAFLVAGTPDFQLRLLQGEI